MAADWDGLGWDSAVTRDAGSTDGGPVQCGEEGARIERGTVSEHHGSYVVCSKGDRTCSNGVWGPCDGSRDFQ
jgi:hypothetical protein